MLARQPASAGAIGALALSWLAMAPPARAAPATTIYTCGMANAASPLAGPFEVSVVTDVPGLPTAVTAAGFDAPSGQLSVTAHITAPKAERDRLTGIGDTTVALYDFALPVGDVDTVRVNGLSVPTSSFVSSADGASCSASAAGNNAAFNAPAAGVHVVSPPSAFTLRASSADGIGADTSCNLKLVAANEIPGGKIMATIGTKRVAKGLLDAKGKLALTLKPKVLKVGSNKVKIKYLGNGYTTPSRTKVCVKVTA